MSKTKERNVFADFIGHKYISLTTFYKSGKGVPTTVEFAENEAKLYVVTKDKSWKVKRIRDNLNATIEPCTMRGRVNGPKMNVAVCILSKEKEAMAIEALKRKYDTLFHWLVTKIVYWRQQEQKVYLKISPA